MTLAAQIRALKATPGITATAADLLERAAKAAERAARRNPQCRGRCRRLDSSKVCKNDNGMGFRCTLKRGHKGPHIACGTATHDLAHWPNDPQ